MKYSFLAFLFFIIFVSDLKAVTATWVVNSGNWDVPSNWSTGVVPDATTDVVITGLAKNVTIPSNVNALAMSITVESFAALTVSTDASLSINGSTLDALVLDFDAMLTNNGIINIGSSSVIGRHAIAMSSSSTLINQASSSININNVTEVAFAMNLLAEVINAGTINIGSTAAVNGAGFAMDNESELTNQSTGLIQINNIIAGDGFYMQLSDVINNGTVHIGNIQPVLNRGISMELNSQYSNSASATTTINNITNTASNEGVALHMSSNSSYSNNGNLLIGNNTAISNNGIRMLFESDFNNFGTGVVEINNITNVDAISMTDEFTNLTNSGIIRIGNNSTVKRMGIFITNLSSFSNSTTGTLNIDNINGLGTSQGIGIYVNAGFTNNGNINIGTNSSLAQYGIYVLSPGALINQSSGTIQINNVSNFDGISLSGASASVTNNGMLHIGNLLAVKSIGISLFSSSNFTNNGTGIITINNITNTANTAGFGLFLNTSTTFTNKGSLNIGNISTISNLGIFVASGNFVNQNSGLIQINNILTFDGIYGSGVGTNISNSATIKIGNLSPVKRFGIYLTTSSIFQNTGGSLEINNINSTAASQGYGIVLTTSSSFTNNTEINIGNISNISQIGLYLGSPSTFNNQASGVLKISRINSFDGIQLVGSAAVFNNTGQLKIGEAGPITRIGILNSGGQFNNQVGGLLEINNVPTLDGIQVFNAGASLTNNGTIHIGNNSGIYRFGLLLSTSGTFTNSATGTLTINNLLSTAANEGIAIRISSSIFTNNNLVSIGNISNISRFGLAMSSTSTFTNNSSGTVSINRITSQSAVSLQLTSKLFNNGNFHIGNIASVNIVGLLANGGSEIYNNAGATMSINNTILSDAIYVSGTATKLVNNSTINLGNISSIGGHAINADLAALIQNTAIGSINISNSATEAILLDGTSTILDNKGIIHTQ